MVELFASNLIAFVSYYAGFCVRYAVVAGGTYFLLDVWLRRYSLPYRVQQKAPAAADLRHEIRWSLINGASTGVLTLVLRELINQGWTPMYFELGARSPAYFAFSVLIAILGYDTYIYWQHRLMHTPWFFRHAHAVHHRVSNTSPFSLFCFHPIETLTGNLYFIGIVCILPMHPAALALVLLFFFAYGLLGHAGYEIFPRGFTRHPLFGLFNTATHHNMHHRHVRCNYGNWFSNWDRWMGTNHPEYHATFDAVKARQNARQAERQAERRGERRGEREDARENARRPLPASSGSVELAR